MKRSFRETGPPAAARSEKCREQHRPESARPRVPAIAEIASLLSGLDEVVGEAPDGRGGVMADDRAMRRNVASLKVRFRALQALDSRAEAGADAAGGGGATLPADLAADVRGILCAKLALDVRALVTEALGYYAIPAPDERFGVNEAPPGGAYARSARQGMLAGRFDSAGTLISLRNRLARRLLDGGDAESLRTGH